VAAAVPLRLHSRQSGSIQQAQPGEQVSTGHARAVTKGRGRGRLAGWAASGGQLVALLWRWVLEMVEAGAGLVDHLLGFSYHRATERNSHAVPTIILTSLNTLQSVVDHAWDQLLCWPNKGQWQIAYPILSVPRSCFSLLPFFICLVPSIYLTIQQDQVTIRRKFLH